MDKRDDWLHGRRLPDAPDAFADAMLTGGERIRRYERRRRRVLGLSAAAAACAALALAAGLLFGAFRQPQPDNVVAAAPSVSAAPSATPEAEPTPEPEELAHEPFEWVRVVDGQGTLTPGAFIDFYQLPRPDARSVLVAEGTLLQYRGEADDGFVKVYFAGNEGYMLQVNLEATGQQVPMYVTGVDALPMYAERGGAPIASAPRHARVECQHVDEADGAQGVRWANIVYEGTDGWVDARSLSFFWESGDWKLYSATLTVVDAAGAPMTATLDDRADLAKLESLIQNARPGVLGQCAQGALLTLNLRDDSRLYFTMPLDGCATLLGDNLAVYDLGDADAFWRLFPECSRQLFGAVPEEVPATHGESESEEAAIDE